MRPEYVCHLFATGATCMLLWMSVRLGWGNSAAIAALAITPFLTLYLAATGASGGADALKPTDIQTSIAIPAKAGLHAEMTVLPN